jgi:esterase/lipase/1-acyl-sn-glycerol-3-phosphate acyltransferase
MARGGCGLGRPEGLTVASDDHRRQPTTGGSESPENYREAPGSPSGAQPVLPEADLGRVGPGPWQQGGGYTRRATGMALRVVEALLRSSIRVEGTQNLGRGPILFVANHFTRFETFILPYIIDRYARRNVHSLAHYGLFQGKFGYYLRAIGAMSTKDPEVKHAIVEELMRGVNDWVIYPEGSMIKDKMIWQKGKFALSSPDRVGPPHSGAAVLALQVEIYRELYLDACRRGDVAKREEYEKRFHIGGELPTQQISVVPINITYYPIRPSKNLFYRIARFMLKELPARLEDELMIEGSLLLDKTDISMYFGHPIPLDRYRELLWPALNSLGDMEEEQKVRTITDNFKFRLTNRLMTEIYTRLTVNFDHLFCSGIRQLARDRTGQEEFHLALFLAARELQSKGNRRRHRSLAGRMQAIIADEPYEPLTSVRTLAENERMLTSEEGHYLIDHQALESRHDFHDIRLKNTLAVIANELEPLREVVKNIRHLVNLPRKALRERTAQLLMQEDLALYQAEYAACKATPHRKDPATGTPYLLPGRSRLGVLLSHGYLASPGEVRGLAAYLNRIGFTVYVVRLQGHGTSPEHLHTVSWTDWLESYDRGYCILRSTCEKVLLTGFSSGGLLAMVSAARKRDAPAGLVAINPPLRLRARAATLAPMIDGWNQLLERFHIHRGHLDFVENHPEWPTTNYDQNYVHGLLELERLMTEVMTALPTVTIPSLIVQADQDPVVEPESAHMAMKLLASERKELAMMAFSRHCIVQGEGSELVYARIAEFVNSVEDSLGRTRPSRPHANRPTGRLRKIS